jgi:hypothetical protein
MTFQEIERLISAPLPASAFKHRAWWSNNPSNSVITWAWLKAGYKTERVDIAAQRLIFRRSSSLSKASTAKSNLATPPGGEGAAGDLIGRVRAALGGTVTFAPGFDPTLPTGAPWDAQET